MNDSLFSFRSSNTSSVDRRGYKPHALTWDELTQYKAFRQVSTLQVSVSDFYPTTSSSNPDSLSYTIEVLVKEY